jgi:hypothetical protein
MGFTRWRGMTLQELTHSRTLKGLLSRVHTITISIMDLCELCVGASTNTGDNSGRFNTPLQNI